MEVIGVLLFLMDFGVICAAIGHSLNRTDDGNDGGDCGICAS